MRNYSTEHTHRQQTKKRLAFEVDRETWESLTKYEQSKIKTYIKEILKTEVNRS